MRERRLRRPYAGDHLFVRSPRPAKRTGSSAATAAISRPLRNPDSATLCSCVVCAPSKTSRLAVRGILRCPATQSASCCARAPADLPSVRPRDPAFLYERHNVENMVRTGSGVSPSMDQITSHLSRRGTPPSRPSGGADARRDHCVRRPPRWSGVHQWDIPIPPWCKHKILILHMLSDISVGEHVENFEEAISVASSRSAAAERRRRRPWRGCA